VRRYVTRKPPPLYDALPGVHAHTRDHWHQKPRLAVLKHNTFALLHII